MYSPYSLDPGYLPQVSTCTYHMLSWQQYLFILMQGPEFIFPVEVRKKSWNEQMFDRTGTCYLTGKHNQFYQFCPKLVSFVKVLW